MSALANGHLELRDPPAGPERPLAPGDLDVDDLRELMQTVSDTSRQLQQTHVILQKEVARLQHELAEANAQLRRTRSLAALGGMAAGIAHEIRNPLASIQLYVQMLAEDLAGQSDQVGLCRKINRAVSSLDAIVRDVLVFARELRVCARPTSTACLFERALEGCHALVERGGIEIDASRVASHQVLADESLLGQALGNVIRNAAEAMIEWTGGPNRPRRLSLGVERRTVRCPDGARAQCVVLDVEDTGPGIPDDVVERMFNPFFTTRTTGTGLGLAIVHRIVDAHGGHINVNRLDPHGTRIELCLRDDRSPQDTADDRDAAHPGRAQTVDIETFTITARTPGHTEQGR